MKPGGRLALVFVAAVTLYLPTVRYGFVQDDRAIVVANPAAHGVGAALLAFDRPYWPPPSEAGLYRPITVLSLAIDWVLSGGRAGWFHVANALWHGLVCVLVALVLARWLPPAGAFAAALLFAVHPVHVEGVANIVSRNELLATAGMLAAVLAARRRWWVVALGCAVLGMLSKERAVITGAVLLLDDWLRPEDAAPSPPLFYGAIALATGAFLLLWRAIGHAAVADVAAPFLGASTTARLAMALPAAVRAAGLLVWPASLSADYSPQVIAYRTSLDGGAALGGLLVLGVLGLGLAVRRRSPAVGFAALTAALAYLPTSNFLFASGIVLAERDLYLPVLLPAAAFGAGVAWAWAHWPQPRVLLVTGGTLAALAGRSVDRLSAWRDNRAFLLTLLAEHPESYRGQRSTAGVLAAMGKAADARAAFARADSLFGRDPHLAADYAFFLIGQGDTTAAARLVRRAREALPRERVAMRVEYLLALARGRPDMAAAVADTAGGWFPWERAWYAGGEGP